jgi:hypothetical protein
MSSNASHGWLKASEAYQSHRDAITGTSATLLEMANLPVHSVWIDVKVLMQRAADELAHANADVALLREENANLRDRIKALEAHEG